MNRIHAFGRSIRIPNGLEDRTEYTFASGDEVLLVNFEGPERNEALTDRVDSLRERVQAFSAQNIHFLPGEKTTIYGCTAQGMAYELESQKDTHRFLHLFIDTKKTAQPWIHLRYRSMTRTWSEVEERFSLQSLNFSIDSPVTAASQGKVQHQVGEVHFELPLEMHEKTLYRLQSRRGDLLFLIIPDDEPHKIQPLTPKSLQIESTGGSYERVAPPVSIAENSTLAGVWYRSTFPSQPPRQYLHYGERVDLPASMSGAEALLISSTAYSEDALEPLVKAAVEIVWELKHERG